MAGSSIDDRLWGVIIGEGHFNPDSGIYRFWRSLRAADPPQYLGVPVTTEIDVGDGHVQQAFASGATIDWSPDTGPQLADDPL